MTSPESNSRSPLKPRSEFAEAAVRQYAALTPEEKAAQIARLVASRRDAIAAKKAAHTWKDPLGEDKRRELGRRGGQASAAKRMARMGPAELQQLEAARTVAALKHQAFTPAPGADDERLSRDLWIRLPRTANRKDRSYVKLLASINPVPAGGFSFEGAWLPPAGSTVAESLLRPSKEFPPAPVILEYCGPCGGGESVYVLWQLEQRVWVELGRARSRSWEWTIDLGAIAARALGKQCYPKKQKTIDLSSRAARISGLIRREAAGLDVETLSQLAGIVHDELGPWLSAGAKGITARFEVITEVAAQNPRPKIPNSSTDISLDVQRETSDEYGVPERQN